MTREDGVSSLKLMISDGVTAIEQLCPVPLGPGEQGISCAYVNAHGDEASRAVALLDNSGADCVGGEEGAIGQANNMGEVTSGREAPHVAALGVDVKGAFHVIERVLQDLTVGGGRPTSRGPAALSRGDDEAVHVGEGHPISKGDEVGAALTMKDEEHGPGLGWVILRRGVDEVVDCVAGDGDGSGLKTDHASLAAAAGHGRRIGGAAVVAAIVTTIVSSGVSSRVAPGTHSAPGRTGCGGARSSAAAVTGDRS